MSDQGEDSGFGRAVHVMGARAKQGGALVVCEHASNRMPAFLGNLGLAPELLASHIAWDPGALGLATALAGLLDAPLVHGGVSRLVYDCNRPPEAPDAIPEISEIHPVPGNRRLSSAKRSARVEGVYEPFRARLAAEIAARRPGLMVTVHSFTPVYRGARRDVQIGILHGRDPAVARAMMSATPDDAALDIRVNEPYGPEDGVAHTLDLHGAANGLASVMIEVRNDLLATPEAERAMAALLAPWIRRAAGLTGAKTAGAGTTGAGTAA